MLSCVWKGVGLSRRGEAGVGGEGASRVGVGERASARGTRPRAVGGGFAASSPHGRWPERKRGHRQCERARGGAPYRYFTALCEVPATPTGLYSGLAQKLHSLKNMWGHGSWAALGHVSRRVSRAARARLIRRHTIWHPHIYRVCARSRRLASRVARVRASPDHCISRQETKEAILRQSCPRSSARRLQRSGGLQAAAAPPPSACPRRVRQRSCR
jgi:hypothetical protein